MVVPQDSFDRVLKQVLATSGKDSRAREDISRGLGLLQAIEKYGHL